MNIDYLRYFLDVAQTKSITHAARLNYISPQGMSRAMNELEKELNCKLLVRYSNKLELSEKGEALIPVAQNVVEQYDNLTDFVFEMAVTDNEAAEHMHIHLLCQEICSLCFIPPQAISVLAAKKGSLLYREMDTYAACNALRQAMENSSGKPTISQIAITCTFDTGKPKNFQTIHRLEELGYVYRPYLKTFDRCLVNANSELATKETITRDEIMNGPIVSTNSVLYESIVERFGDQNILMTTGEYAFRRRFVSTKEAITFVPAIVDLFEGENDNVVARDFDDAYEVEIGFLGLQKDLDSPLFQEFVAALDAFYRDEHADNSLFTLI